MKKILKTLIILFSAAQLCACAVTHAQQTTEGVKIEFIGNVGESETSGAEKANAAASLDKTPPVIEGVKDILVHIGETVAYKKGITVTDDTDPDPKLTVDAGGVDTSKIGTYEVVYIAEDASGNKSTQTAKVSVVERDRITTDMVEEMVDEILSGIISEDMSVLEKLSAIYHFVAGIGYVDVNYGEAEEYLENAWYYYNTYKGDCRCTYALTRVLIEGAGFKAVPIENVAEAPIMHYWNLVSVDGGEKYYHFDPTAWVWADADVFMFTDKQLREYADRHRSTSYMWDETKFPATPKAEFEGYEEYTEKYQYVYEYADIFGGENVSGGSWNPGGVDEDWEGGDYWSDYIDWQPAEDTGSDYTGEDAPGEPAETGETGETTAQTGEEGSDPASSDEPTRTDAPGDSGTSELPSQETPAEETAETEPAA